MKKLLYLLSLSAFFSCASGYKTIAPNTLNYVSNNTSNDVILKYKYEVLKNKKYSKKEDKHIIKLVSIEITNNSIKDLVFGENLNLVFNDGSKPILLDQNEVYNKLKQQGAFHLFYLLLSPTQFQKTTSENGVSKTENVFPIGLILGPAIAGSNIAIASSANKKFKKELDAYNLFGKTIKKGETKHGLIGIRTPSFEELKLTIE